VEHQRRRWNIRDGGGTSETEVEHQRRRWNIRDGGGRGRDCSETEAVEAEATEAVEVEGCIGGGGMHWKHQNASEEHGGGWS
jgi:hypothetical protein